MRTLHSSLLALGTAAIAALGITACNNDRGTAPAAALYVHVKVKSAIRQTVAASDRVPVITDPECRFSATRFGIGIPQSAELLDDQSRRSDDATA